MPHSSLKKAGKYRAAAAVVINHAAFLLMVVVVGGWTAAILCGFLDLSVDTCLVREPFLQLSNTTIY